MLNLHGMLILNQPITAVVIVTPVCAILNVGAFVLITRREKAHRLWTGRHWHVLLRISASNVLNRKNPR